MTAMVGPPTYPAPIQQMFSFQSSLILVFYQLFQKNAIQWKGKGLGSTTRIFFMVICETDVRVTHRVVGAKKCGCEGVIMENRL